ncbi:DNA cytosine methyltransferase [uncultured Microbulbifer sp.]|uniref:DNA cytosine methyltransferase n=1 Tax=uncultured Microbulbifer sp. TaxID=348147 RepID=UPI00261874B9|nr:DNA cytosine methyltransferase [uncultured Microbulbifer sp.]
MDCIDLFAGLGGQTTGAVLAGHRVLWAANHWPVAVEYHSMNHPETIHSCQDLQQADFSQVPAHDVLLASPCCQGHSKARGKNANRHDASRSTAWAVVAAAEACRPQVLLVENVPEFLEWSLYPAWADALQRLGYTLAPHIVDAADYGVPQHRVRLFLVGTRSARPLHLELQKSVPVSARQVIELDAGNWSPIHKPTRSAKTLARIERGRRDLRTDTFLIPYYGSGSGLTGRSLDRPIGTLTTRERWAVVRGDQMRMLTVEEQRDFMSFPACTRLPKNKALATHLLGNAVAPELEKQLLTAIARAA